MNAEITGEIAHIDGGQSPRTRAADCASVLAGRGVTRRGYRGFGQVRTVVGEHYGAGLVAVPVDRVAMGKAGQ